VTDKAESPERPALHYVTVRRSRIRTGSPLSETGEIVNTDNLSPERTTHGNVNSGPNSRAVTEPRAERIIKNITTSTPQSSRGSTEAADAPEAEVDIRGKPASKSASTTTPATSSFIAESTAGRISSALEWY